MDLVFFAAVYGASHALTFLHVGVPYRWIGSKIDKWILRVPEDRDGPGFFKILTNCTACTSFWIALPTAYFWHSPSGFFVADAFACAGIVWAIYVVLSKLGQHEL